MIESIGGFILLGLAVLMVKLLAVPIVIIAYVGIAVVSMLALSGAIVAVALGCRGVDRIRGI